jgi:hypothetical protein
MTTGTELRSAGRQNSDRTSGKRPNQSTLEMRLDTLDGPLVAKVPLEFGDSYDITGKRAEQAIAPFEGTERLDIDPTRM